MRRLLAISGSLRAASSNHLLLEAFRKRCEGRFNVEIYDGIEGLPHFNPDRDVDPTPANVQTWRKSIQRADAIVISSPEYAFGVPGALKDAFDWTVSSGDFDKKPVIILNASSTEGVNVQSQLELNIRGMGGVILLARSLHAHTVKNSIDPVTFESTDPATQAALTDALEALSKAL